MAHVVTARFHSSLKANQAIQNLIDCRFPPERITAKNPASFRSEQRRPPPEGADPLRWGAGMGATLCGAMGGFGSLISLSLPGGGGLGHPFLIFLGGVAIGGLCGAVSGGFLGVLLGLHGRAMDDDQPLDSDIVVATTVLSAPEARRAERALLLHVGPFTRETLDESETPDSRPL